MSTIFDSLKHYSGKYTEKSRRLLTDEEKSMVKQAIVVPSEYGLSCMFIMASGTTTYIPMARDAKSGSGEILNINTLEIITLGREGSKDIDRILG